jgi:TonB family protein
VLLERLESGLLLFQTPQGLVPVEPSFWQRIYLLWTFRNFRQLPLPLLNARQATLVNALFRSQAGVVQHKYDPWLVIGVVENFVPPPIEIDAALAARIDASLAMKARLLEEVAAQDFASPVGIDAAPAMIEALPTAEKELPENVAAEDAVTAPKPERNRSFAPGAAWAKFVTSKFVRSRFITSRLVIARIATAVGALSLCVISVFAWHWIQAVPGSQPNNRLRVQQIDSAMAADSSPSAKPVAFAESSTAIAPPAATAQPVVGPRASAEAGPDAGPEAAVKLSSVKSASITSAIPSPRQRVRVHDTVSRPKLPLSGHDIGIQATRPPLRSVYPIYSDLSARGVVAMTAQVNSDGTVRSVRVVSGNRALAAAAVRAVRQWRYRPYLKDGQAVATETNIVISFFSDDAISMSFPPSVPVRR